MNTQRSFLTAAFRLAAVLLTTASAPAQLGPSRTVTVVNPLPAGGATDVICRLIGEKLQAMLGQSVVVENRTGAAGSIAGDFVTRSSPDGQVLICAPEFLFISHLLNPKQSFDPRNLEPVSVHVRFPAVITARRDLPASDIRELIDYARLHPNRLNYASQGPGSMAHILFEAIKIRAKIDMVHVPYRGGAPALTDLMAGQIDVYAGPLGASLTHIQNGRLKALAVTTPGRVAALPDVPAVSEVVPGLSVETWNAFAAPPRTPKEITDKISQAIAKVVQMPDVKARFAALQADPVGSTPQEMQAITAGYLQQMAPVIAAADIRTN
jgi:tripartite-type tricarboxylate transporter receptor subunit TctC